jgi:hypothetical protein
MKLHAMRAAAKAPPQTMKLSSNFKWHFFLVCVIVCQLRQFIFDDYIHPQSHCQATAGDQVYSLSLELEVIVLYERHETENRGVAKVFIRRRFYQRKAESGEDNY